MPGGCGSYRPCGPCKPSKKSSSKKSVSKTNSKSTSNKKVAPSRKSSTCGTKPLKKTAKTKPAYRKSGRCDYSSCSSDYSSEYSDSYDSCSTCSYTDSESEDDCRYSRRSIKPRSSCRR